MNIFIHVRLKNRRTSKNQQNEETHTKNEIRLFSKHELLTRCISTTAEKKKLNPITPLTALNCHVALFRSHSLHLMRIAPVEFS